MVEYYEGGVGAIRKMIELKRMKRTKETLQVIFLGVMVISLILFATKLNFDSFKDKEPVYWIFYLFVLIYVLVFYFSVVKSYKTNNNKFRNISILMGLVFIIFLIWLYY